jgi:deazaflavin-dependent oxidoreductase (nitroreductase family)
MSMPADIKAYNRQLIAQFRADGGPPEGRPLLLLTTTGARTGQRVTTPMMRIDDDGRLLVIASNSGATRHPDWFHNLLAHPDVFVEVAGDSYPARAVVPTGRNVIACGLPSWPGSRSSPSTRSARAGRSRWWCWSGRKA